MEAAGEAVLVTDAEGVIEYVNPSFTEITGYDAEEVVGETPRILKSGREEDAFYGNLWQTITAGRTFRGEMVNRRKEGTLYDQEATITPVPDDQGEIRHFVAVCRDVTVRRELDRQLQRAHKMEAGGQMAAGIFHDFRNLLNVIQVNVELLRAEEEELYPGRDEVDGIEYRLEQIRTAADRGAQAMPGGGSLSIALEEEAAGAVATADLPVGSEEVLVVEDEAALRRAAKRMLTRLGYSVATAGDGREALAMTLERVRAWDLVVTDLIMPEMGGVELFESLQNRGLAGPIVFMSGPGADETAVSINPDRSRHFLQKPWTVEALARTVRRALDTCRERFTGCSSA